MWRGCEIKEVAGKMGAVLILRSCELFGLVLFVKSTEVFHEIPESYSFQEHKFLIKTEF